MLRGLVLVPAVVVVVDDLGKDGEVGGDILLLVVLVVVGEAASTKSDKDLRIRE